MSLRKSLPALALHLVSLLLFPCRSAGKTESNCDAACLGCGTHVEHPDTARLHRRNPKRLPCALCSGLLHLAQSAPQQLLQRRQQPTSQILGCLEQLQRLQRLRAEAAEALALFAMYRQQRQTARPQAWSRCEWRQAKPQLTISSTRPSVSNPLIRSSLSLKRNRASAAIPPATISSRTYTGSSQTLAPHDEGTFYNLCTHSDDADGSKFGLMAAATA